MTTTKKLVNVKTLLSEGVKAITIEGYIHTVYEDIDVLLHKKGKLWYCTDILTGYLVSDPANSRGELVEELYQFLSRIPKEEYKKVQSKALEEIQKYDKID
jgi:hypothetical protein